MEADLKQTLLPLINTYLTEKLTMDELDCSLSERGLDSLAFIEIIVVLEKEFSCTWPLELLSMTELDTLRSFWRVINACCKEEGSKVAGVSSEEICQNVS